MTPSTYLARTFWRTGCVCSGVFVLAYGVPMIYAHGNHLRGVTSMFIPTLLHPVYVVQKADTLDMVTHPRTLKSLEGSIQ